jgi:hypothetical protein
MESLRRQVLMAGKQKSFQWQAGTLTKNMKMMEPKVQRALIALTETYATKIESAARSDAPWTDRTANARNGLTTATEHLPTRHTIILFHKVPYGIWLEVVKDGKNAIIMPTIRKQSKLLMATLDKLMRRL